MLNAAIVIMTMIPITLAENFTRKGDYDQSNQILANCIPSTEQRSKYHFLKAVNHFALNEKEGFLKAIEAFDWSVDDTTPRRYKNLVLGMKYDFGQWDENPLSDIKRDMKKSADRLDNAYAGKKTQKIQDDIVKKLDKLIKEQEDKNKAAADAAAKNAGEPFDPAKHKIVPGSGSDNQIQPAPDSIIMGGKGKGIIDAKTLRGISENWGTMPPAARAKVINELTRDLPPKYEEMIKNYFDALNKLHNVKP